MKINGQHYEVISVNQPMGGSRTEQDMNRRGLYGFVLVRRAKTGKVEKVCYLDMNYRFAGWVRL